MVDPSPARGNFKHGTVPSAAISPHLRDERMTTRASSSPSVRTVTRSAKLRLVLSGVLGVASFAFFVRGAAYYVGTGLHDGEDLPSFATFLVGAALLLAAVLIGWSVDDGATVCGSSCRRASSCS
jgi:hypothetical protein